jgi:hypothetical protein
VHPGHQLTVLKKKKKKRKKKKKKKTKTKRKKKKKKNLLPSDGREWIYVTLPDEPRNCCV